MTAGRAGSYATLAVAVAFGAQGLTFASTIVRLPELRTAFGLDYAMLGFVLLAPALGGLLAAPVAARLVVRLGGARAAAGCAIWWAVAGLPIAYTAPHLPLLAVCLLAWGAGFVGTDVCANTAATAREQATGRSLLSRMHGMFSAGALVGALLGGAAAQYAMPLGTQLGVAAAVQLWVASLMAVTSPAHHRGPAGQGGGLLAAAWRYWPLVAVSLLGLMAEGAVTDWTAVFLTDLGAAPLLAGAGFAAFSATMLLGRMGGDHVIERVGRLGAIRLGAITAAVSGAVGFTATHLTSDPLIGTATLACFGLGLSVIFPAAIAHAYDTAAEGDAERAAAATASGGYFGVLIGPPVIGQAAHATSLSWALLLLPAFLVGILVLTVLVARAATRPHGDTAAPDRSTWSPPATDADRPAAAIATAPPRLSGEPAQLDEAAAFAAAFAADYLTWDEDLPGARGRALAVYLTDDHLTDDHARAQLELHGWDGHGRQVVDLAVPGRRVLDDAATAVLVDVRVRIAIDSGRDWTRIEVPVTQHGDRLVVDLPADERTTAPESTANGSNSTGTPTPTTPARRVVAASADALTRA